MEIQEYVPAEKLRLETCPICERKFLSEIITKHKKACFKASKRKMKLFDSGKQRATGTGIAVEATVRPGQIVPFSKTNDKIIRAENKKHNWKVKHTEFINAIRMAREYAQANAKGDPPPVNIQFKSTVDPDLVQCEYCHRRFNENSAERHIPFCKEQHARNLLKPANSKQAKSSTMNNSKGVEQRSNSSLPTLNPSKRISAKCRPSEKYSPHNSPQKQKRLQNNPPTNNARQKYTLSSTATKSSSNSNVSSPVNRLSTSEKKTLHYVSKNGDMLNKIDCLPSPENQKKISLNQTSREERYAHNSQIHTNQKFTTRISPVARLTNSSSAFYACSQSPQFNDQQKTVNPAYRKSSPLPQSYCKSSKNSSNNSVGSNISYPNPLSCISISDKNIASFNTAGQALRSGRTQQDYINAQAFARDLVNNEQSGSTNKNWNPTKDISNLKLRPGTSSRTLNHEFLLPGETLLPNLNGRMKLEHNIERLDTRILCEPIKRVNKKDNSFQKHFTSGIPVRATRCPLQRPTAPSVTQRNLHARSSGRFCLDCGAQFPSINARFCSDCGMRKMAL